MENVDECCRERKVNQNSAIIYIAERIIWYRYVYVNSYFPEGVSWTLPSK